MSATQLRKYAAAIPEMPVPTIAILGFEFALDLFASGISGFQKICALIRVVIRKSHHKLQQADVARLECGLTIREIIIPGAEEEGVEAQRHYVFPIGVKRATPVGQR